MAILFQQSRLTVLFIKEGDAFVTYSPALDLSSSGATVEEAKKNFQEALTLFMEECINRGTLPDALASLGWQQVAPNGAWSPPEVVGQFDIPMPAQV